MSDVKVKSPVWFWIVSLLLLAWGLLGVTMYYLEMTMTDATYLEKFGQTALDLRDVVPVWSIAGYAVGVWIGLLGAICLLLRKKLALTLYIISILGAFVGWIWYVINAQARVMMSESGGWIMLVVVFALCFFSIWFAKFCIKRGWLT